MSRNVIAPLLIAAGSTFAVAGCDTEPSHEQANVVVVDCDGFITHQTSADGDNVRHMMEGTGVNGEVADHLFSALNPGIALRTGAEYNIPSECEVKGSVLTTEGNLGQIEVRDGIAYDQAVVGQAALNE